MTPARECQRAFAYLRVSGKGQVEGDGFTRQLLAIRTHAEATAIDIITVFEERAVSGTIEGSDRPAFSEMLAAMCDSGITTVVVERLDRLARDLMIQENIIRDMRAAGFTLISVAEPDLCSTDPTRVLIRQMIGAVAQYDKAQIVAKLRGARERTRAAKGRCEGAKPYGALPGESEHLDTMRRLQANGASLTAITAYLNNNNIKTRRGTKWHPYVLSRILARKSSESTNQHYKGTTEQ